MNSHQKFDFSADAFPDYPHLGYQRLAKILAEVSKNSTLQQYTRDYGHPRLVAILSKYFSKTTGCSINPLEEILVTCGGQEAFFSTIAGHVDAEDEVILFGHHNLIPTITSVGGTTRIVPLEFDSNLQIWAFDQSKLEGLFSSKSKLLILSNPDEETGKVYSFEELQSLARLCQKYNVVCVVEDTYKWLIYSKKFLEMSNIEGMEERTISITSGGKMLGVTGWRIGWACGPEALLHNLKMVHQNSVYTGNTPMQEAIAIFLEEEYRRFDLDTFYFKTLQNHLREKRDSMVKRFQEDGYDVAVPEGGLFITIFLKEKPVRVCFYKDTIFV